MKVMKYATEEHYFLTKFLGYRKDGIVEIFDVEELKEIANEEEYNDCLSYSEQDDVVGFARDLTDDGVYYVQLYKRQVQEIGYNVIKQHGEYVRLYSLEEVKELANTREYELCETYNREDVIGFVIVKEFDGGPIFVQIYESDVEE